MKKTISLLLAIIMTLALTAGGSAKKGEERFISPGAVIDTDGSDGYSGDYVVIYNPSTSVWDTESTGNMSGRILTEVGENISGFDPDRPFKLDADPLLASEGARRGFTEPPKSEAKKPLSFNVGDTHYFSVYPSYSPFASSSVLFKVLAKGEHCYIWTPASDPGNAYPLDAIDPSFAQICADEFDSKFDLMQSSFGDHDNGSQGDGRLNLLYYNIDDGWQPGSGYIAGFFYSGDLWDNGMPVLNVDTYPGVYYVNSAGESFASVSGTFGTMVHEYQHLINYSVCGYTEDWINECMSSAAEEICYPGSCVISRIQSWIGVYYSEYDERCSEYEYVPSWQLHNGFSMYDWMYYYDDMDDLLALYAQVSLFSQYIYTRFGNDTFRKLLLKMTDDANEITAFKSVTGVDLSDFTRDFRIAVTANVSGGNSIYGFKTQPGYDPNEYGLENPYDLLAPVVFTGSSCSIAGGGAICVKPVGGVYYPPSGASSSLKYYGVTLTSSAGIPGDADGDGLVTTMDALIVLRCALGISGDPNALLVLCDMDGDGKITTQDALIILRSALDAAG